MKISISEEAAATAGSHEGGMREQLGSF